MSKYFTSVYKNYYDKIYDDKNIETYCNTLVDKISNLDTLNNNLISSLEGLNWYESGKNELLVSYFPLIKKKIEILKSNILVNLSKVVKMTRNDLLSSLEELKVKDEEYCDLQNKLNMMNDSDRTYNQSKLDMMDKILVNLVNKVDDKILEIKSLNDFASTEVIVSSLSSLDLSDAKEKLLRLYKEKYKMSSDDTFLEKLKALVEENKIKKLLNDSKALDEFVNNEVKEEVTNNEVVEKPNMLDGANCIDLSLFNQNWKVVNTNINVSEYQSLAYNKGIRQNSNPERYGDLCLAFSYVHASNLASGQTSDNAESAYNWAHASEFYDYFNDNKQETLQTVYNEIIKGKPVIMQVNGNKSGTSRHFVTVVGVKDSVKNASDVKDTDLLILDSWDGQLETMDSPTSRFMTTGKDTHKSYTGYYLRIMK